MSRIRCATALVCGLFAVFALAPSASATITSTTIDVSAIDHGYNIASNGEQWNMVTDLMNWETTRRTVYVRVRFTYATGTDATSRDNVRPLWLDADGCSLDSYISVPTGLSDTHRDVRSPIAGNVIAAAGHIHDHGINVELTNNSAGEALICNSVAGYSRAGGYEMPDGRSHVADMTACIRDTVALVRSGDTLRPHTIYEVPAGHHEIDNAMGIMLTWVDP